MPGNSLVRVVRVTLNVLTLALTFQADKQSTTDGMVDTMFNAVFDKNEKDDRKVQVCLYAKQPTKQLNYNTLGHLLEIAYLSNSNFLGHEKFDHFGKQRFLC